MIKFIALLFIMTLVTGCGVGVTRHTQIESVGIKVGDSFILPSVIVYECKPRDTTSEFWFSSVKIKRCLKASTDVTSHDKIIENIASGASASISSIKYINGIDTTFHLVYFNINGIGGQLIVYEFNLSSLIEAPNDVR